MIRLRKIKKYTEQQKLITDMSRLSNFTVKEIESMFHKYENNVDLVVDEIMKYDGDFNPRSDYWFPVCFIDPMFITGFLTDILNFNIEVVDDKIQSVHIKDNSLGNNIIIDVEVKDINEKIYAIEIQRTMKSVISTKIREVFYNVKLISEQSTQAGKYEKLNPVYVIFINEHSNDNKAFKHYTIMEQETKELHSEYLNIINVNLDLLTNENISTMNNDIAKAILCFLKFGENIDDFKENASELKIPQQIVELFVKKSNLINNNRRELLMKGKEKFTTSYWLNIGKAEGISKGEAGKGIFDAVVLITKYNATINQAINDLNLPSECKDSIISKLKEQNYNYLEA